MTRRKSGMSAWLFWSLVAIVLLAALLGSPLLALRGLARQAERELKQAVAKIAASGAPVEATDLARPPVPDAENAALLYQKAFEVAALSEQEQTFFYDVVRGKADLADPKVAAQARDLLDKLGEALRLIHQASTMPRCDFALDWSKGPLNLVFPHLAKLRECSRLLMFESTMLLRQGRVNDAVATCGANFRLAKAAEDQILIGSLVEYAIIAMASKSLETVLSESRPSASVCKSVASDIAGIDLRASYVAALEGERAVAMSIFDEIRADPAKFMSSWSGQSSTGGYEWILHRGSAFTRWWLACDKVSYIHLMERVVKEASLPYRETLTIHPSVGESVEALPRMPPRIMTEILVPTFSRASAVRDRAIATLGLAEVALLLKAYRADHGSYPESLDELAGINGRPLPTDPFSGKPFVYRREGAGFLIYSWGQNLLDDGGTAGQRRDEGDIVFQCLR